MMPEPMEKQCEACGERFQCGQYPCWCRDIPITDRQYDWIAARYADCLCPCCLGKISLGGRDAPDSGSPPSGGAASGVTGA